MKPFISHDGTDVSGIRAEVHVQLNEGVVKKIEDNAKGTSDIYFTVGALKFPVHGWIGLEDPVYALVKAAFLSQETVTFRIESQRKRNVDRSIPIAELRLTTEVARENTTPILAGLNGVMSTEALTNPAEDPKQNPSGRLPATAEDMAPQANAAAPTSSASKADLLGVLAEVAADETVAETIVAAIAAQAIIAGVSITEVHATLAGKDRRDSTQPEPRNSFTVESPGWKEFNSDGRLNLGSLKIQAGVHVEGFVRSQVTGKIDEALLSDPAVNDAVEYFTGLVLAIADRVQVSVYGEGFRSDRGASSHSKIRSIVHDTINKFYKLPLSEELTLPADLAEVDAWVGKVGKLSVERFRIATRASTTLSKFKEISAPASLLSAQTVKHIEEVVSEETIVEEAEESTEAAQEVILETPVVEEAVSIPDVVVEPELAPEVEPVDADAAVFMPVSPVDPKLVIAGEVPAALRATPETVKSLQEFVKDSDIMKEDLPKLSKLLAYTFGSEFKKATALPDEDLLDFLDFYVAEGSENFVKALNQVESK